MDHPIAFLIVGAIVLFMAGAGVLVLFLTVRMVGPAGVAGMAAACFGMVWLASGDWWAGALAAAVPVAFLVGDQRVQAKRLERAVATVQSHAQELAIRRAQLVHRGAYGVVDHKRWNQEIGRFIVDVLGPVIGPVSPLGDMWSKLRDVVDAAATSTAPVTAFRADLSPIEYEQLVADTLRRHGWDAQTTRVSGDQGIDVLATKGALRVVLQCKLYSRAVGNDAVQQAIAGQRFELATHAVVVSSAAFTRSARELASAGGVVLLHHEQLGELEPMLMNPTAKLTVPRGNGNGAMDGASESA